MSSRRTYRSVQAQTLHYLARPSRGVLEKPLASPAAWRASDFSDEDEWTYRLAPSDVAEIEHALRVAPTRLERLGARDFPLPRLSSRIAEWGAAIGRGRGFVRLRGVPVDRWTPEDSARFFWALGQHLGRPGAQNGEGHLLGHVRDLGLGREGQVRQYKTSEAISYHCDAADAVGLLCMREAKSGGRSRIASSVAIFNRILESRPDLAPLLFEPMYFDARGDGGVDAFIARPCAHHEGRLRTFYHAEYMRTAERHPNVPPLTARQHELLDLYDRLASSPELCLQMDLEPGDVQLISNHTIVHARTAFVDDDDPRLRRWLLRLWLSLESPASLGERALRARALVELVAGLAGRKLTVRVGRP